MATRFDRYFKQQMKDRGIRDLVEKELTDLELGIKIARLRERENLNQTQLAARAGMNASKISLLETSARNVTLNTLARIAHALNTRIRIEFLPRKVRKPSRVRVRPTGS
jgi:transcriptional regulator with XRE-family HTH domain